MMQRSSPWRALALAVATFAVVACSDDDVTGPTAEEVAGTWIQVDPPPSAPSYTVDTLRLSRDGVGTWSSVWTWVAQDGATTPDTVQRPVSFERKHAGIDMVVMLPCDLGGCYDGHDRRMGGRVRSDTLTLWYTDNLFRPAVEPASFTFVKVSAEP